jgi:hypothetical protein
LLSAEFTRIARTFLLAAFQYFPDHRKSAPRNLRAASGARHQQIFRRQVSSNCLAHLGVSHYPAN